MEGIRKGPRDETRKATGGGICVSRHQPRTEATPQDVWCSPGGIPLSSAHRLRLLNEIKDGWIDDFIVTAAMNMLKVEHPHMGGLRPSSDFYGQERANRSERLLQLVRLRGKIFEHGYVRPDKRQAQILYTGRSHWVLISNYHDQAENVVYVYDSFEQPTPEFLLEKIAAVFRFSDVSKFRVIWPMVDQQKNNKDCGIFAIAFLVALCQQNDPTGLKLESSEVLREHVIRCYESGTFSSADPFPTRLRTLQPTFFPMKVSKLVRHGFRIAKRNLILRERAVSVICFCRMPPGKARNDRTVICQSIPCMTKRFHERCIVCIDDTYRECDFKRWTCAPCRALHEPGS
ncbi:hypothetical protein RvY_05916 [Ramazzottius varieornatus]|uniref:Ubiquitin-like protease family profile domain-containing protein n=1 Tax=Ramazzottius varieornatus TaxID=947166 RepID=A0A1D1V288_RAMVA|nr:hypothetical protein RvY_05916 [Ramazzottius varieornatus]